MANVVLFISEQYLKDLSVLDENVDMKLLRISILEAQEMHIRHAIGSGIYDQLVSQKAAGTLTALNTTLLDTYIAPALKQYAMYEGASYLSFKFTNKSIVKKNSENSTAIEGYDIVRFMDDFKRKGEYYLERMRKYLIENNADYPLFYNPGNAVDTIHPDNKTYGSIIYTHRKGNRCTDEIDRLENPGTCC